MLHRNVTPRQAMVVTHRENDHVEKQQNPKFNHDRTRVPSIGSGKTGHWQGSFRWVEVRPTKAKFAVNYLKNLTCNALIFILPVEFIGSGVCPEGVALGPEPGRESRDAGEKV
jgi:hypothetical protein